MYYRPRLIPCLTIKDGGLVKTVKFSSPRYIGDPINSVKIFNGKNVDELCILDITASLEGRAPNMEYLKDIAGEAFMPLSYGGGITSVAEIERIFHIGYEKVVLNSSFVTNPNLIRDASNIAGSQSIVVSIDVKKDFFGRNHCYIMDGKVKVKKSPIELAKLAEEMGAGEILLNSIDRDGTMSGYDLKLVSEITKSVNIPVIACGGAKDIHDFKKVIVEAGAHAASAGSMYVYYGAHKAVLITTPTEEELLEIGLYNF